MAVAEVVDEGFLRRYQELLDAEDAAFDELEHPSGEGDRSATRSASPLARDHQEARVPATATLLSPLAPSTPFPGRSPVGWALRGAGAASRARPTRRRGVVDQVARALDRSAVRPTKKCWRGGTDTRVSPTAGLAPDGRGVGPVVVAGQDHTFGSDRGSDRRAAPPKRSGSAITNHAATLGRQTTATSAPNDHPVAPARAGAGPRQASTAASASRRSAVPPP